MISVGHGPEGPPNKAPKPEPLWGYLVVGTGNGLACAAAWCLNSQSLSLFGAWFVAVPLLVLHVGALFPLTLLAIVPRRSRAARRWAGIIVAAIFVVGFILNLSAVLQGE